MTTSVPEPTPAPPAPTPAADCRALFLIEGLGTGGAERSLAELLDRYRRHGIEPIVARFHDRPEGVEAQLRAAGEDIRPIAASSRSGRVRAVRALLRAERPDVLHTTHFEADVVGRLAAVGTGVPVVSTLAVPPYLPVRREDRRVHPAKLRAVQALDGWTARHLTTRLHAVSDAVADQAVRALRVPRDRITVVPRGRDEARLGAPTPQRRTATRAELRIDEDAPLLLAVGRHEYQKAHTDAIEATATIRTTHPGVVLLVAGRTGATTDELRALIATLGLGDAVRLLGHRDDVGDLLCAADVVVVPSLYEGSPGAVLEAMALGRPVVAADFAGVREVVLDDDTGLIVPTRSPAALARAVTSLLDDPTHAAALGAAGRARFEQHHTLDVAGDRMAALLRDVAAAGR